MIDLSNPEALAVVVAAALAAVFERVPLARSWFDRLTAGQRQLFMSVMVAAVAMGAILYQCQAGGDLSVSCAQSGTIQIVMQWLGLTGIGLGVNQGAHRLSKRGP